MCGDVQWRPVCHTNMPPRLLNHVHKPWPASALAMLVSVSAAPGLADSSAPLQTRVELAAELNPELRDWRPLLEPGHADAMPLVLPEATRRRHQGLPA